MALLRLNLTTPTLAFSRVSCKLLKLGIETIRYSLLYVLDFNTMVSLVLFVPVWKIFGANKQKHMVISHSGRFHDHSVGQHGSTTNA
jgi:hypothetical protein